MISCCQKVGEIKVHVEGELAIEREHSRKLQADLDTANAERAKAEEASQQVPTLQREIDQLTAKHVLLQARLLE